MRRFYGRFGLPLLFILVLVLGLAGGIAIGRELPLALAADDSGTSDTTEDGLNLDLLHEAWQTINRVYVDRSAVTSDNLTYGAITGMVDALGDTGHSRFMSPEMVEAHQGYIEGEFEGIGAYVEMENGLPVIVTPIDNSPAQRAGLQPGDVIVAVNGEEVAGLPLDEVVQRVLGPAGTDVTLTIFTPETNETRDVTVTRARISLDNVTWEQVPGTPIAHVRIAAFSQGVSEELRAALEAIHDGGLTGIVLDLRNNPGGLLPEAIETTSQFISEGDVMLRQNADGEITAEPAQPGGLALDIPVVVLINEGSASASEIVSGALQEHERATLVGQTTFGTGTVLQQFRLSDGSAMLLATEQWLTPDGRVIWHQGIDPDYTVALPPDAQPLLPQQLQTMTAEEVTASGDEQLLQALELLETADDNS